MKKKLLSIIAACMLMSGCGTSPKELPVTFTADLTHDGKNETIEISVVTEKDENREDTIIYIKVKNAENQLIYDTEMMLWWNHGAEYYLIEDGGEYFLLYYTAVDHCNTITCEYSVFHLDPNGENNTCIDIQDEITASYWGWWDSELDVEAWTEFADRLNSYLDKGFLLVSTIDENLQFSTEEDHITFQEDFSSLVEPYHYEDGSTMSENLEKIKEYIANPYL